MYMLDRERNCNLTKLTKLAAPRLGRGGREQGVDLGYIN